MRPASNSTVAAAAGGAAGFRHWNSPIPYLFGGLAMMLGLIAMALIILACSFKKSPPNSHGEAEEKPAKQQVVAMQLEMEPKIVVIMAGDENPTYLANPVSSTRHIEQV